MRTISDAEVRRGEQTYDEMMVGFFDAAVPAWTSSTFLSGKKEQQKVR